LPFGLDIAGFADEEGARFQSTYLGSRVMAGTFDYSNLKRTDAEGVTLREAILRFGGDPDALHGARLASEQLIGYAEVHIEQGPVLQEKGLPVGVVTAIAGQTRIAVTFAGHAAHAGTTPMPMRRDALLAAGRLARDVETIAVRHPGLLATVGQMEVLSGASNVVPGVVRMTLDVRHAEDAAREAACELIETAARFVACHRRVELDWRIVQTEPAVRSAAGLTKLLKEAAAKHAAEVLELPSGAGHDAAALAAVTPVAMLFVRCKDGISHHPDESVAEADVLMAIRVLARFLELLAKNHG
jgi:allantoate deiminase